MHDHPAYEILLLPPATYFNVAHLPTIPATTPAYRDPNHLRRVSTSTGDID